MASMTNMKLRMKNGKKAVTPVIATIILIAATIVLALVVGAYTFGLFGSNVKIVTLTSATLYGGVTSTATQNSTSSLVVSLNNPGSATFVTSVTMSGNFVLNTSPITTYCPNSDKATGSSSGCTPIVFTTSSLANGLSLGQVTSLTFYPTTTASESIITGQVYNYVINMQNGQSVSGSLIAQ